MRTKIRHLMSGDPSHIRPEADLVEAARVMGDRDLDTLPICADHGTVIGVISERDIAVRCVAEELNPRQLRAVEFVRDVPVPVESAADVEHAAKVLDDHGLRSAPVVAHGRLVGMIRARDLPGLPVSSLDDDEALRPDARSDSTSDPAHSDELGHEWASEGGALSADEVFRAILIEGAADPDGAAFPEPETRGRA